MRDPTRDEMLSFLDAEPYGLEFDEFDREEAVYWFASDHHGGQSSNLYAALCASPFRPGAAASSEGMSDGARMLYGELEAEFAS